ncbi:MAG: chaperonin GroEL [Betaproteobacteria bacterium]|nr:chaperonin GroEL [Betaproteobacteria bacterium]
MASRSILFHDDARERIRRGVALMAEAVMVTLGPRGRTVILQREFGPPQVVNSGVMVARAIELDDPFENMGAQLVREVAARTSELAGDGTTTATVLTHAMVQGGLRYLAGGMNPMGVRRGIERAVQALVAELARLARPCASSQEIAQVAAISANNDRSIGELLAGAIDRVGREGAVSIEDGSGLQSELRVVEGMRFEHGMLSPYFVTDAERQCAVLEEAAILVAGRRLSTLPELLPLLEAVVKAGRPLLVIAEEVEGDALATLVVNTVRGGLRTCAVRSPGFGDRRKAMLQDIATLTGATVVGDELGVPLAQAGIDHLGHARRIEVGKDDTTLIGGAGKPSAIAERVAAIRHERGQADSDYEREWLDTRIARLAGGVAVIRVGAATETELKERRLRVDDALHATRAAVQEGIVPGGGVALLRARRVLETLRGDDFDEDCGIRVVARAVEEPLRRIVANAGEEPSVVLATVLASEDPAHGYNAASRAYGDLLAMGVIDPARVTRLALQNAASIAALILATDCLVASRPSPREPGLAGPSAEF